jgi:hypothetical protein
MIKQYSSVYSIPFVGRTNELVDITTRLMNPECQLLTLTGLGGSGKTRLAIQAATSGELLFSKHLRPWPDVADNRTTTRARRMSTILADGRHICFAYSPC